MPKPRIGPSLGVRVVGLAAGYDGRPALRDVTFEVAPGDRVGVLGPNGAGKTTLFRVLLGLIAPMSGDVEISARPASVPQTERSRLDYPVSALDVVLMGTIAARPWWRRAGRSERQGSLRALERVGLAEHADASFGELSGGQRQRVLVARALVQDAAVLTLDEPFGGLDAPSAELLSQLLDRLAAQGRIVFVSTHDIRQAMHWDQVLCLNRRQVAFGPPAATLTRAVIEATYAGEFVEVPRSDPPRGVIAAHHHAP